VSRIFQHGRVYREITPQFESALRFCLAAGKPVKYDLPFRWRQKRFDMVKHCLGSSNAVNSDNLATRVSATLKYVLKDLLLQVQRFVETGTRIEADFTNVTRLREVAIPQFKFARTLCDQLRMQPERSSDMLCALREFVIAWPR
jgi:hypothetical protein